MVGIEPFADDTETPPLDMLALLGAAPAAASQAARVIVVQTAGEQLRLLARGALTLTETPAENLLPLPLALQNATPLVSHIARRRRQTHPVRGFARTPAAGGSE